MATETASSVIRAALSSDINLTTDQLIEKVKAKRIKASPQTVKNLSYNIRSALKKTAGKSGPRVKAAARHTVKPSPRPVTSASPASEVPSVLANVALVNKVMGLAGGPENVRQVMKAVKACGGVEAFLQHLELVAGIRGDGA